MYTGVKRGKLLRGRTRATRVILRATTRTQQKDGGVLPLQQNRPV